MKYLGMDCSVSLTGEVMWLREEGQGQASLQRNLPYARIDKKELTGVVKYSDNVIRELSGKERATIYP